MSSAHLRPRTVAGDPVVQASSTAIAKIIPATPTIVASNIALKSLSTNLTINGRGFDSWQQAQPIVANGKLLNVIAFESSGPEVKGLLRQASATRLIASFTHLSPFNSGTLSAAVVVNATWSSDTSFNSAKLPTSATVSGYGGNTAESLRVVLDTDTVISAESQQLCLVAALT